MAGRSKPPNYALMNFKDEEMRKEERLSSLFKLLFKNLPLLITDFDRKITIEDSNINKYLHIKNSFPEFEIGGEKGDWYISYSTILSTITKSLYGKSVRFIQDENRRLIGVSFTE